MSDILFIGVDPGLTGAVVMLDPKGDILEIYDLETITITKKVRKPKEGERSKPSKKKILNGSGLYDYLKNWITGNPGTRFFATMEKQQPFPIGKGKGAIPACPICGRTKERSEGVVASFTSGDIFGTIRTIINIAHGIPIQIVSAAAWKNKFSLIGKSKEDARLKALELWPGSSDRFKLKKHHNRAEACFIGIYGMRYKWDVSHDLVWDVSRETGGQLESGK